MATITIPIKGPIVSNDLGDIYHWLGWDACCPRDIQKGLERAAGDDVIFEINSNGGMCTAGFEIYTTIMKYQGKTEAHVINAASAASLPVCAADKALASDTAIFMIHNAQSYADGDYRDMQMTADALIQFNESVINAYVRKTGKSRGELQELMDNDTYMSPQKAIDYGFIDDFLFGEPCTSDTDTSDTTNNITVMNMVMNGGVPILSEEKAHEIKLLLKDKVEGQNCSEYNTASDIVASKLNTKKGEKRMTLEEMYAEYPELKNEVDALIQNAREEGVQDAKNEGIAAERARLHDLDELTAGIPHDMLYDAKYGNPINAEQLAYQALKQDGIRAAQYLENIVKDSKESGVNDIGVQPENKTLDTVSANLAAHINAKKGR